MSLVPIEALSGLYKLQVRSHPNVGHGSRRVEELADDVGGGSNAEDNCSKDLFPPREQQHWVLSPTTVSAWLVHIYQTNGIVTFLPVTLAVGEVVAVVYSKKKQRSSKRG